ncbi:hypothetical protein [Asticcacaulis sp. AC402]|uniref:hypothetical protein n=1 Tax=Asticcacaulis sp. AC402 TaxID=1282361 RepID=UPI0003F922FC|nr:hypothetical protein [Asticcacaulis sp. AC402]
MYVRFVTPLRDRTTGAETGFFRASWYLREVGCPDWIHRELDLQFDWFNAHLPIPGRVGRHFKRRGSVYGVCWFQPDATECIQRARYCAWLVSEGGVPVQAIKLAQPREIIWRDDYQLVVRPDPDTPLAFSGRRFRSLDS